MPNPQEFSVKVDGRDYDVVVTQKEEIDYKSLLGWDWGRVKYPYIAKVVEYLLVACCLFLLCYILFAFASYFCKVRDFGQGTTIGVFAFLLIALTSLLDLTLKTTSFAQWIGSSRAVLLYGQSIILVSFAIYGVSKNYTQVMQFVQGETKFNATIRLEGTDGAKISNHIITLKFGPRESEYYNLITDESGVAKGEFPVKSGLIGKEVYTLICNSKDSSKPCNEENKIHALEIAVRNRSFIDKTVSFPNREYTDNKSGDYGAD